jgi:hypothetical protein
MQIDYALGEGGRNFVCGFGNNPHTHAQHRSMFGVKKKGDI